MYTITNKADGWHIAEFGFDWGITYPTWSEAYDALYNVVSETNAAELRNYLNT